MVDVPNRHEFNRLHETIEHGFEGINDRLDLQNGRIRKAEESILVIQTERTEEEKQAVKRSTWAGVLAAAGFSALVEVVKIYLHLK